LIHTEQVWDENYFTAKGNVLHTVVDEGIKESRKNRKIARSVRLVSFELGVSGVSDVVEFIHDDENGIPILNWNGKWRPYPVEYKWGTAKNEEPYIRQLCAQAICLEEMLDVRIFEGALFFGATKHRITVSLDEKLRMETKQVCNSIRTLLDGAFTPSAEFGSHCYKCSLYNKCMPKISGASAKKWIDNRVNDALKI
jgi:CRISPR-associated exonuclease Cas4